MNINHINKDVAKEFITIVSYCDEVFIENIPKIILQKLNTLAADSVKDFYVDKNKSLMKQDISDECENLISKFYFTYMIDLSKKEQILKQLLQ